MASYSHVRKGAQGEAVTELQKLLNQNGYSLDVDGNFGAKTQAAVRDYQSKNNLTVDGIVGNETWSSLFGTRSGGTANSTPDNATTNWLAGYDAGSRPSYSPSQAANDAAALLAQYEGNRPGAYQSTYAEQIQSVLDKIMNREAFSYDFASDPMYQQYADRYQQQGKLAMMDTMGQAAALTGGYGSSYSQAVGQQAYQSYLQGLNDVIPELRNAAYQVYQDEGNQMLSQMDILRGLENTEYGRYRDTVGDWYNDRDYYYGKYNDLTDFEYNQYLNDLAAWQADRAYAFDVEQAAQDQARWEAEFALSKSKSGGSSGSGSSNGGGAEADAGSKLSLSDARNALYEMYKSDGVKEAATLARYMIDRGEIEGLTNGDTNGPESAQVLAELTAFINNLRRSEALGVGNGK